MAWQPIARTDSLPVGECRVVETSARKLALYRLVDGWYCTQNECLHQGGYLGDGIISRGEVVCPVHQWRFDIKTGACQMSPGTRIRTYPCREVGEVVEVDLEAGTPLTLALPGDDGDG